MEQMPSSGKLSLYKQATPLERSSLAQGRLEVSTAALTNPNERDLPWSSDTHPTEATPHTVTEVVSSQPPVVQVVRHPSPRQSRFSSSFAPPSLPEERREGGEGEKEEKGEEREAPAQQKAPLTNPDPPLSDTSRGTESSRAQPEKKTTRKPKGRVIPSRYLSSAKATPSLANKTLSTSIATNSSHTRTKQPPGPRKSYRSEQKPTRKDTTKSLTSHARDRSSNVTFSSTLLQQPFTPSAIVSSTPKPGSQQYTQNGSTLQGSFTDLTANTSTRPTTKHKSKVVVTSGGGSKCELELDLLYCRLLQASYLDVKSAKSLRLTEEAAKSQLQLLWGEVERRRVECERLRQELETVKRNTVLSSVLEVQEKELAPVVNGLPQLQQQHSALAVSLDATRHELPTSGLLPVTERELESELSRSDELLSEIVTEIIHNVPSVVAFAGSTEAAVNTLDREFQELKKCWKELSAAVKLQVKETSLDFERKQRTKSPHTPNICTQ